MKILNRSSNIGYFLAFLMLTNITFTSCKSSKEKKSDTKLTVKTEKDHCEAKNNVQNAIAWEFELIGSDPTTYTKTIEADTEIEIKIYKVGALELTVDELKELKLQITRKTTGTSKIESLIDGVLELKGSNALTLANDQKSATKKLTIEPHADTSATFCLQLQDKSGSKVGHQHTLVWKNGAQLELAAQYDVKNKGLTIIVKNSGKVSLPANQAKLIWDTGDSRVTVAKHQQGNKNIGELKCNQDTTFVFKDINFTDPVYVPSATLKLELAWNQLEKSLQKNCTLTDMPIDVIVSKLEFNKSTGQIVYAVKNNSQENIKLQVHCFNTKIANENAAIIKTSLPVQLNLTKASEAGSESGEQALQVDFKGEDAADFKFELLFGEHPINFKYSSKPNDGQTQIEINQSIVTCTYKQIKLKFIDSVGNDFPTEGLKLQGNDKQIKFKIGLHGNAEDMIALKNIDKAKLKLLIITQSKNAQVKQEGTNPVKEVEGKALNLDNLNIMTIEPGIDHEVKFILYLKYDKKGDGTFSDKLAILPVNWKEDVFEIIVTNPTGTNELIGNELCGYNLRNITGTTNPSSIMIQLEDDRGVILLSSNLAAILKTNHLINKNMPIGPIFFDMSSILNANKKEPIKFNIIVKKDGHQVTRTMNPVSWRPGKKVDVKIASIEVDGKPITEDILIDETNGIDKQKIFTVTLQNDGDDINTGDIGIELINTDGVAFNLGKITGSNIRELLTRILGADHTHNTDFPKGSTKTLLLQISDVNPSAFTKINLSVRKINGEILVEKHLIWVGNSKYARYRPFYLVTEANDLKLKLEKIAVGTGPYSFGGILQGINITTTLEQDIQSLRNALQQSMLNGFISPNGTHISGSSMQGTLQKIRISLNKMQEINEEAKAINNGEEIAAIRENLDKIQNIYNGAKNILESKATEFAQKILEIAQKHARIYDIKFELATATENEKAINVIFLEVKQVLDTLLNNAATYYPAKNIKHPFNIAMSTTYSFFAEVYQAIAKKYKKENNIAKGIEYTEYAKKEEEKAKQYTINKPNRTWF